MLSSSAPAKDSSEKWWFWGKGDDGTESAQGPHLKDELIKMKMHGKLMGKTYVWTKRLGLNEQGQSKWAHLTAILAPPPTAKAVTAFVPPPHFTKGKWFYWGKAKDSRTPGHQGPVTYTELQTL